MTYRNEALSDKWAGVLKTYSNLVDLRPNAVVGLLFDFGIHSSSKFEGIISLFTKISMMKNLSVLVFCLCSFALQSSYISPSSTSETVGGAYLVFAQKMGGEVTLKQIQKECELNVAGCAKGSRIFTYTLIIHKKGKKRSFRASSNELTKEMMAELKGLSAGDTFQFKSIKAYLPNGQDKVDVFAKVFTIV